MEWRDLALAIGLLPDGFTAGERHGVPVRESAYTAQSPEVVVKGPVFHHQYNNVLNIGDRYR